MAIRNVVLRGDPILQKKARTVDKFDERLGTLIDDMIETMHKKNGVGIAAPQVGILRRVVIVEPDEETTLTFVNPEIIEANGAVEDMEGCLSVPEIWGIVERPESVTVRAWDAGGRKFKYSAEGHTARIICHEIDHLDGILFTDKVIRYVNPNEDDGDDGE